MTRRASSSLDSLALTRRSVMMYSRAAVTRTKPQPLRVLASASVSGRVNRISTMTSDSNIQIADTEA